MNMESVEHNVKRLVLKNVNLSEMDPKWILAGWKPGLIDLAYAPATFANQNRYVF